jgi:hypothetical protein
MTLSQDSTCNRDAEASFGPAPCSAWACSVIIGTVPYLFYADGKPAIFRTQREARALLKARGFTRTASRLSAAWRGAKAIRVTITPNDQALRPGSE